MYYNYFSYTSFHITIPLSRSIDEQKVKLENIVNLN